MPLAVHRWGQVALGVVRAFLVVADDPLRSDFADLIERGTISLGLERAHKSLYGLFSTNWSV